jgi:hypothetical protein
VLTYLSKPTVEVQVRHGLLFYVSNKIRDTKHQTEETIQIEHSDLNGTLNKSTPVIYPIIIVDLIDLTTSIFLMSQLA